MGFTAETGTRLGRDEATALGRCEKKKKRKKEQKPIPTHNKIHPPHPQKFFFPCVLRATCVDAPPRVVSLLTHTRAHTCDADDYDLLSLDTAPVSSCGLCFFLLSHPSSSVFFLSQDIDAAQIHDPQMCVQYVNDIYAHLRESENVKRPRRGGGRVRAYVYLFSFALALSDFLRLQRFDASTLSTVPVHIQLYRYTFNCTGTHSTVPVHIQLRYALTLVFIRARIVRLSKGFFSPRCT